MSGLVEASAHALHDASALHNAAGTAVAATATAIAPSFSSCPSSTTAAEYPSGIAAAAAAEDTSTGDNKRPAEEGVVVDATEGQPVKKRRGRPSGPTKISAPSTTGEETKNVRAPLADATGWATRAL
jgi:hypothetical protein